MIRTALRSHWTIFTLGAVLMACGLAVTADGLDDHVRMANGQYVRDHDEAYILFGALLVSFGFLFAIKGGKAYLNR